MHKKKKDDKVEGEKDDEEKKQRRKSEKEDYSNGTCRFNEKYIMQFYSAFSYPLWRRAKNNRYIHSEY